MIGSTDLFQRLSASMELWAQERGLSMGYRNDCKCRRLWQLKIFVASGPGVRDARTCTLPLNGYTW
eukprot:gene34412-44455_t